MKNWILIFIACAISNIYATSLVSPKNNFVSETNSLTFKWEGSSIVQNLYKLEIATDSLFLNVIYSESTVNTQSLVTLSQANIPYYWHVYDVALNEYTPYSILTYVNLLQIPELSCWYDAGQGVTLNGGLVSKWNDKSASLYHMQQANSNLQPTINPGERVLNNHPTVQFGIGGMKNLTNIDSVKNFSDFTFYILKNHKNNSSAFQTILSGPGPNLIMAASSYFGAGPSIYYKTGLTLQSEPTTNNIKANFSYYKYSNDTISVNGDNITLRVPNYIPQMTFAMLGARYDYIADGISGDIAEVIMFNRNTTNNEDILVNNYLRSKYTPPINLGTDTIFGNSFCDTLRIYAEDRFVKYQWSTGDTTSSIKAFSNGTYRLTTTDVFGNQSTDDISVLPYKKLPKNNVNFCINDTLKIDLGLNSSFNIQWSFNGNIFSTNSLIRITQPGLYSVVIYDIKGCVYYDTIRVAITNISLNPIPVNNQITLCENEKIYIHSNVKLDSIRWSDGDTLIYNSFQNTGLYNIYARTTNGCVINQPINVTIAGKAPTAQFAVAPACQNAALAFTDSSKVPAGNTIQSWNWTFSNNSTSSVQNPSTTFSNLGTQTASLKIKTNVGCTDSIAKTFVVNRNPTPSFYNLLSCEGMPTIFADQTIANAAAVTDWSWNFGGLGISNGKQNPGFSFPAAGNYLVTLKATNSNGCSDTISRQVAVNSSPNANFSFDSVCGKTPVNLKFLATVQAPSVIPDINWGSWDFGDGTIETAIRNPQHIYNEPGTYDVKLVVKSSNQCLDTVVKQIKVFDFPVVDFTISPTQCVGKSIQFTDISATPDGTPISKWNWYFSGLATDTIQHPKYTFNSQGNYTIQLTAQNTVGCSNTKLRSIAVSSPPIPKFTFSPQNGLPPLNVNYVNQSATNGNYLWNYGDGGPFIAGYNPPPHVYTAIGTYPIKLVATDFRGCTDTLTKFILVDRAYLDGVMASISLIPTSSDFYKVQVSIINNSNVEITALGLSLQLGGGAEIRENWTGSLLPGQTTVYLFNGELRAGDNSIPVVCASIDNVNNNATENRTDNNTTCKEIKVGGFDILTIFPNPAYDNNINFGVMLPAAGKVNIRFVDVLGQQMYQHDFDGVKGYNQFAMPIGMLNATVYVAEVSFDGEVVRKKFMRKNR